MLTQDDLTALNDHWAVACLDEETRVRAFELAQNYLIESSLKGFAKTSTPFSAANLEVIKKVQLAYEIAAAEGLEKFKSSEIFPLGDSSLPQAAAFRGFELARVLPIPDNNSEKIFHVLHLAAMAYFGDRWSDLRRWLNENKDSVQLHDNDHYDWDRRLISKIYAAWISLLRKSSWEDLTTIGSVITQLRQDQQHFESNFLKDDESKASYRAHRLIALYHWARATELLGTYTLQGEPTTVLTDLDQHYDAARAASLVSGDFQLDVLLRWLHIASRKIVNNSIWQISNSVDSRAAKFVRNLTAAGSMFELLPPQRVALQKEHLLDPANRAVIVDLPTSSGKTMLAQFRILQALNQFQQDEGWVAYVAPTKALVSQITRRLRRDFAALGIAVEQMTGSLGVDSIEDNILQNKHEKAFHVLVATPEKLTTILRKRRVARPLVLLVVDEAQTLEDDSRGLRLELLLAITKREHTKANFLLLMPYVPNGAQLANWLGSESGVSISLSTSAWQPNERVVGTFKAVDFGHKQGDWSLEFETLETGPKSMKLQETIVIPGPRPLKVTASKAKKSLSLQTGAIANAMSRRGTSIAVVQTIAHAWSTAEQIFVERASPRYYRQHNSEAIKLVQKYLADEVSPKYRLIQYLDRGVAVHHSAMSDDARALIEWLTEENEIEVLCATSTLAHGINFPVSSVFLSTLKLAGIGNKTMPYRSFWNLAGRAGRLDHGTVGVVGIASGNSPHDVRDFVKMQSAALKSQLLKLLEDAENLGKLSNLESVIRSEQWDDFRTYIAHLVNVHAGPATFSNDAEQVLRNTFGFYELKRAANPADLRKAQLLLEATKQYANTLSPSDTALVDLTGFTAEGVSTAIAGLRNSKLTETSWSVESLFGKPGSTALSSLMGVMMSVPQLRKLNEISGEGFSKRRLAKLACDWVSGKSISDLGKLYFPELTNETDRIGAACQSVYKTLAHASTWGISALSHLPGSGLDFGKLNQAQKDEINLLPAMLYHGVKTAPAVLMRMNCVPRSLAERMGSMYTEAGGHEGNMLDARDFLRQLDDKDWQRAISKTQTMSGADYKTVWKHLSGNT